MGDMTKEKLNGIDTEALKQVMGQISKDPSLGKVKFQVTTTWKGTTKSETVIQGYEISGQKVKRIHTFVIDEPKELLGEDTAANPQEYLMGAMNACIMNTYVIRGDRYMAGAAFNRPFIHMLNHGLTGNVE